MRRLRRLWRLPAAERSLFVQAGLLVLAVRLGLWLLPFRTVLRCVRQLLPANGTVDMVADPTITNRVARAVAVTSRHIPAASCLTQALATQVLLRRRRQPAVLQIGVARNPAGRFMAHAWIESQGRIVIGNLPNLNEFTPLPALETAYL